MRKWYFDLWPEKIKVYDDFNNGNLNCEIRYTTIFCDEAYAIRIRFNNTSLNYFRFNFVTLGGKDDNVILHAPKFECKLPSVVRDENEFLKEVEMCIKDVFPNFYFNVDTTT